MHPKKLVKSRVNQVDESHQLDGGAETVDPEVKSDQDQALRRTHQKSGRFYETISKLFGRKVEEEKISPEESLGLSRFGRRS
jgi:hypothetical protein